MRRRLPLAGIVLAAAIGVPVLASAGWGRADAPAVREVAAAPPTYARDVAAILDSKCAGCHTVGGIAPFALTSGREAKKHAPAIAAVTRTGRMPPWQPGPRSPAYVGQAQRRLTARERDTIARWAAAGAPLGTAPVRHGTQAVARPPAGARRITVAPARAYVPSAAAGASDDYRCFLLDPRLARDAFVVGAAVRPQRRHQVHHVILFEAAGAQAAAAERLDRASGGRGWTCFGGPNLPVDLASPGALLRFGSPPWVAAWAPGTATESLPAGVGVRLRRGSKLVMQVHYNLARGRAADRSRVALMTVPATAKRTPLETMLLAAPVELPCPAGASGPLCDRAAALARLRAAFGPQAGYLPDVLLSICRRTLGDYAAAAGATACDRRVDAPLTIRGVAGHMHTRGREIEVVVDPGTPRERVLLHIPSWSFHWQDAYYLRTPIRVAAGQTLRLRCRFDATAHATHGASHEPRYVVWGEGTDDEMCLGVLHVEQR